MTVRVLQKSWPLPPRAGVSDDVLVPLEGLRTVCQLLLPIAEEVSQQSASVQRLFRTSPSWMRKCMVLKFWSIQQFPTGGQQLAEAYESLRVLQHL